MLYIDEKGPYFHREFVFKQITNGKPLDILLIKTLDSLDTIACIPHIVSNYLFNVKTFREGYLNGEKVILNGVRKNVKDLWMGLASRFSESKRKKMIFRQKDILKAAQVLSQYHLMLSKSEMKSISTPYRKELNLLLNSVNHSLICQKRLNTMRQAALSFTRE